jgi:hypothetical protein
MKNIFTITWQGSKILVDYIERESKNIFFIHFNGKKRKIVSEVNKEGIKQWRGKGRKANEAAGKLGELIELAMDQHYYNWGI